MDISQLLERDVMLFGYELCLEDGLLYSMNLLRESTDSDGLRGPSTSWKMMQLVQLILVPLQSRFLLCDRPVSNPRVMGYILNCT